MGTGCPDRLKTGGGPRIWIRAVLLLLVGALTLVVLFSGPDQTAVSPSDPSSWRPALQAERESSRESAAIPLDHDQRRSTLDSARRSSIQPVDSSPVTRRAEPASASSSAPPDGIASETAHPESPLSSDDADPAGEDGWSIAGTVFDDAGTPLPGIAVHAQESQQRAVTDALGMFELDRLEAGAHRLFVEESARYHGTQTSVLAGTHAADLHLQRKGSIKIYGQVFDFNGQPVINGSVRVLGTREQQQTDNTGAYEVQAELTRAGTQPVLDFTHPDFRDVRKRVATHTDDQFAAVRVDVVMDAEHQSVPVLGWVIGPHGEAVADARVNLSSQQPQAFYSTISDERGEFSFDEVEIGTAYRIRIDPPAARYKRYLSDVFEIGPDGAVHEAVLQASDESVLSGLIVDLQGQPVPDLTFWLRNTQVPAFRSATITTGRQGHFEAIQVPAGSIQLGTTSVPALRASGIVLAPGETREVLIPVDWGQAWLLGRVVDDAGEPVSRANVVAQWERQFPDVVSSSRRQTLTDLGGYFNFANLGASTYRITVQADGFATTRTQVALQPGDETIIQLRREKSPDTP